MVEKETEQTSHFQEQDVEESWREVGLQFEALGDSLSKAVRAAWQSEQTQQHVRSMETSLQRMVGKVKRAVDEASESERGKELRAEAEKTADSLRAAGEQTWEEARPQLVSVLKSLNSELDRVTRNLERRSGQGSTGETDTTESSGALEE